jgi:serine protease AprX
VLQTGTVLPNLRLYRAFCLTLLACLLTMSVAPATQALSEEAGRFVSVIVQGITGSDDAREAVESVGGQVTYDLPIVEGVSARVPQNRVDVLRGRVRAVVPNEKVELHGSWKDPNITHRIQKIVRSTNLWNEGITGAGVTVALLDTGIYAQHPDLQGPGGSRVIHCEDFTSEADTEAHCADTFGHGTFMAGLIAGNGASSNGKYKGAAPEANLVALKAAGFDGSTDVSKILAGVQWAVAHKDVYGIRVLNLSLGSDSAQDYRFSPLNYAVERAWESGIAVVVSAGNSGPGARTIMKPGDDPFVITVGASSDQGSVSINDDTVPVFSSRGPTKANGLAKPDVVSPGVHTVSLQSPGSAIDQKYGSTARVDGGYFRGSGTSMSTATVSGVVAQVIQANPSLSPDQVKHRLTSTGRGISEGNPFAVGAGLVDATGATHSGSTTAANQGIDSSSGNGLLALDRGGLDVEVVTPAGQLALTGEFTSQVDPSRVSLTNPGGLVPLATTWKTEGWDATTWKATTWKTEDWAATTWKATTWKNTEWDATTWKGTLWSNSDWDATTWKDVDWDATTWKATTWKSNMYAVAWD